MHNVIVVLYIYKGRDIKTHCSLVEKLYGTDMDEIESILYYRVEYREYKMKKKRK